MRLKVLHISSGNLFGGVETLLMTLARERNLCPSMEPHFALCFEGRLSQEIQATGAPLTLLGPVQTRFPWTIWNARHRLASLLQTAFAAVICHMPWSLALFGPTILASQRPLVFWMHDAAKGRHWIEKWAMMTKPALTLCNSNFTASTLPALFPESPYKVIMCPVSNQHIDLSELDRATLRAQLNTSPNTKVIIQISRMEEYKGHVIHLEALARLKDEDWVCWIVGGAQRPAELKYYNILKALSKRLGIDDRIRFLGQRHDVPRLLAAGDIFCQPNLSPEPFGIVFIEALYAGLPIVATNIGGALEIIDENCGTLVPPNHSDLLAEALQNTLKTDHHQHHRKNRAEELCNPQKTIRHLYDTLSTQFSSD